MRYGSRVQPHGFSSVPGFFSTLAGLRNVLFGETDWQVQVQRHRVDLRQIESALERHPGVRECAVAQKAGEGGGGLVAYIVRSNAVQNIGAASYSSVDGLQDLTGDSGGATDSRGEPAIPECEIRESLDQTVERIGALKPAHVLEIGCGSGQILFRVAPRCVEYVSTDVSSAALEAIERNLPESWGEAPRIRLRQQAADDFSGITPASFDLVVINFATQSFPSVQYLVNVLEKAVNATREGGVVLVGDIPNLPLLVATSAPGSDGRLRQGPTGERGLMIDPAFFDALARRTLGIGHVEVLLKRGHYTHDWPRFRYDALLYVGERAPEEVPVVWRRWRPEVHSLASFGELCAKPDDIFAFQSIPNRRICSDGIDPEEIWRFASEAGFEADITWSATGDKGAYDVVLRRGAMLQARAARSIPDPMPWDAYANRPAGSDSRSVLISQWRRHLQQELPEYMVPEEFIVVEFLPRKANGEIDRRALHPRIPGGLHPPDPDPLLFPAAPGAQALS